MIDLAACRQQHWTAVALAVALPVVAALAACAPGVDYQSNSDYYAACARRTKGDADPSRTVIVGTIYRIDHGTLEDQTVRMLLIDPLGNLRRVRFGLHFTRMTSTDARTDAFEPIRRSRVWDCVQVTTDHPSDGEIWVAQLTNFDLRGE